MAKPQALVYSMISRDSGEVVAEHSESDGDFKSIAMSCLQKLLSTSAATVDKKFTYGRDAYTFTFLLYNPFAFCVVAEGSSGTQLPIAFLDRVKEEFILASDTDRGDFGMVLKKQMQYCMDHPQEVTSFFKLKAQVDDVKNIMIENIDKVVERGTHIQVLVDKSDALREEAKDFRTIGGQVKRKLWMKNMKVKLIVLAIIVVLTLIIVVLAL